jgi:NAD dependent epimerase/dehydratase
MKIFVTGSEGFIGSHLVEKLIKEGHEVKAFVLYNFNNSNGWLDTLDEKIKKKIIICKGDVRDLDIIKRETKNYDVIIHLAALIGIPYSYFTPRSYIDTNVVGTLNILQAARENKTGRVIITSTSEVYGSAKKIPISEDHPLQGQSPYSASKISADQIAMSFYNSYNLPVIILRPFNTFGPRQSERAIIPVIIRQIINSKNNTITLGNIAPTRDFNYVEDICDGFIASLNKKNIFGKVFNLGTGHEISIKELVLLISKVMKRKIKINTTSDRIRPKNSEVDRLCASNKKAIKYLKWKPLFVGKLGFKKALIQTIKWHEKENFSDKKVSNKYVI